MAEDVFLEDTVRSMIQINRLSEGRNAYIAREISFILVMQAAHPFETSVNF